jgi:hypothetical protein
VHEATPDVFHDDRPALWIFPDVRDSRSHPVEEVLSKAGNLQFIIDRSVEHFLLGRLHHANSLFHNRARASWIASAAERAGRRPSL